MSTALIVTADLGGNVPPALGIGRELARRGWDVHVLGDDAQRPTVRSAGLAFEAAAHAYPYDPLLPRNPLRTLRDIVRVFGDRERGRDAVRLASAVGADVVLVDGLLIGTLAECEEAGLRTVALVHTVWTWFARHLSKGPIAALLRWRGFEPLKVLERADLMLVASARVLDPDASLPAGAVLTGPVQQDREPVSVRLQPPRVLVSFSSIWYPGQRKALRAVLAALAELPVDAVVTTGPSLEPDSLHAPGNATIHRVVDHGELLPETSLVIGHGGHATTVRALAHGIPLLILPMHPLLDQPLIGRAVAAAGGGITVRKSARPAVIRAAVIRLLDEPSYRARAALIGQELRASDGAVLASDELQRLVAAARAA